MHRSGTTWLFNTVRMAVLEAGPSLHSGFGAEIDPSDPAEVHVQKIHAYREPGDATVLMMTRDLRGVAASAVRMGLVEVEDAVAYALQCWETEDQPYRDVADLRLRYEWMMVDKVRATALVLDTLDLPARAERVYARVEGLRIPEEGVDPETHLHAGHVTSRDPLGWSPLPQELTREIEALP